MCICRSVRWWMGPTRCCTPRPRSGPSPSRCGCFKYHYHDSASSDILKHVMPQVSSIYTRITTFRQSHPPNSPSCESSRLHPTLLIFSSFLLSPLFAISAVLCQGLAHVGVDASLLMARYRAAFGEDMNKLVDLFDSMLEVHSY